jgi:hypothetical protein
MSDDYKPRFVFDITDDQKRRSDRLLGQYGLRKAIFSPILDEILDMIELHGGMAIGLLLSGTIKAAEVIPTMKKVEEIKDGKLRQS